MLSVFECWISLFRWNITKKSKIVCKSKPQHWHQLCAALYTLLTADQNYPTAWDVIMWLCSDQTKSGSVGIRFWGVSVWLYNHEMIRSGPLKWDICSSRSCPLKVRGSIVKQIHELLWQHSGQPCGFSRKMLTLVRKSWASCLVSVLQSSTVLLKCKSILFHCKIG